ncbi:hypothetical protein ACFYKX_14400 [Cytobacillus sp. FJAT-54145]|uniref:SbsC C-terminal domain-containing protein n=1 Tax=Cytobacillus spartinae TaxID=3299023 RepID=A0ABW6KC74_9BACI
MKSILSKTILSLLLMVTVAAPTQASVSYSSAEKLVRQAESYAGSLKWAISIEGTGDGKSIPWKYYNGTKDTYKKAKAAVSQLPKGFKKSELEKRLEEKVNLYISTQPGKVGRAVAYIDAINAGKKIENAKLALINRLDAGLIDDETERLYHNLSWELKKQSFLLDRVYGQTTRDLIRQNFKRSAENVKQQALYPVSIKMALDKTEGYIDHNQLYEASNMLFESKSLFVSGEKLGLLDPSSTVALVLQNRYSQYETKVNKLSQELLEIESVFVQHATGGTSLRTSPNHYVNIGLIDAHPLKELSIRHSDIAAKTEVSVTRTINGEQMTEELATVSNEKYVNVDLSNSLFNLPDPRLKETNGFEGILYTFTIKVTNQLGQVQTATSHLQIGPYEYGVGFHSGTFISDFGYSVFVPANYKSYQYDNNQSITLFRNEACLIDDPIEGTLMCDPSGEITIKVLDGTTEVSEWEKKALIEHGQPVQDVAQSILSNEKYHVFTHTSSKSTYLYELVAEIDGHLIKINYQADRNSEYVLSELAEIMKSIKF